MNFDDGVVQHGSSGSPILNEDKKVVGQLHGNQFYNPNIDYCSQPRAEYGRFDLSWSGGGTDRTRLSNWLDPENLGSMETNTSRSPLIIGPPSICNQDVTYSIQNLPSGASVSWTTHPDISVVSQTDSSLTVERDYVLSSLKLDGWIEADISGGLTLSKENIVIWKPGITQTDTIISGTLQSWGGEVEIPLELLNYGASNVVWKSSVDWQPTLQGVNFTQFFGDNIIGDVTITVDFLNPCGEATSIYRTFQITN